jgi:hypothetical protein
MILPFFHIDQFTLKTLQLTFIILIKKNKKMLFIDIKQHLIDKLSNLNKNLYFFKEKKLYLAQQKIGFYYVLTHNKPIQ